MKDRKLGRAIRKLQNSKSAAESLRILDQLKKTDPETYRKLQSR
jgi:hypothetical protein